MYGGNSYDLTGGAKYSAWTYFLKERKLSPSEGSAIWAAMSPERKENYKHLAVEHSDGISSYKPRKPKEFRDPQFVRRGKLAAETYSKHRKQKDDSRLQLARRTPLPQQTAQYLQKIKQTPRQQQLGDYDQFFDQYIFN